MDHVGGYHNVFIDELGRVGAVGKNPPHLPGTEKYIIGPLRCKKILGIPLSREVKLSMRPANEVCVAVRLKPSHDRGTNHPAVPGDIDLRIWFSSK